MEESVLRNANAGPKPPREGRPQSNKGYSKRLSTRAYRAKSFPKVTILFCRLPLPTFSHLLEAIHLGDLLRFIVRVRMSEISPENFQGSYGEHPTLGKSALPGHIRLLSLREFHRVQAC